MIADMQTTDRLNWAAKLEQLHQAALVVAAAHDVDSALRAIVETARQVADADLAALGVPGSPDEPMAHFVVAGLPPEALERAGPAPMGHGVLGVMLNDGQSLRLEDIHEHPAFSGYPSQHPDIRSFLGVPIRTAGEVVGDLYLANKQGGALFTEDDQRLIEMLAAHAAVVIQNLRFQAVSREAAVLQDREQIARQLEDDVLQNLYGIGLLLGTIDLAAPNRAAAKLSEARLHFDDIIERLRKHLLALASNPAAGQRIHRRDRP